ncbi:hypothetical protein [Tenacibaculum finnmarkense]|uniref:hypothetical protein n=1 Tax=Tenacibaculum finnmarkense TaxID=2781243 RepID=UPI00187B4042|nr:hypothetical protein [Tenacibaculum finnmarkense]MBE7646585.1 hypothetical protein [Tenacibaculum finnmarkense genomovar ulcerans]MBE7648839.1 hypothetical protein [Tenacibaculum finnmarkense genomovar ulcerans]MCD8423442.1 hypothetical protein [Tenacibaculum finnmarkense genomovar ulcerans]MCD8443707.1 hypothetical protein [Tenacibaculum finnmarkense genomovar ulcerans]MCG8237155.1 hypothetical protein [Tenacibaculum finnmarkense genomovar ulcerans]
MKKILTDTFYKNITENVIKGLEKESNKLILNKVDWEKEANKCFKSLTDFFRKTTLDKLQRNNIDTIGVIDICWNEYDNDIEVDFMPDNNFATAFKDGCIMNNSAIDNDDFFKTYFDEDIDKSLEEIGDDYEQIILAFYYIIKDIIKLVVQQEEFKKIPKKSPCHFGFASFHDQERTKILTIE